jgi:hypothetical protein
LDRPTNRPIPPAPEAQEGDFEPENIFPSPLTDEFPPCLWAEQPRKINAMIRSRTGEGAAGLSRNGLREQTAGLSKSSAKKGAKKSAVKKAKPKK